MASVHKKHNHWYVSYTDAEQVRHMANTGIPHSPGGADELNAKNNAKLCEQAATNMALEYDRAAESPINMQQVRKRCEEIHAKALTLCAELRNVTFSTHSAQWINAKRSGVSSSYFGTLNLVRGLVVTTVLDVVDKPIRLMQSEHIDQVLAAMRANKLSDTTICGRMSILSEMFTDAYERGYILSHPVLDRHFPDGVGNRRHIITPAEATRCLAATPRIDWRTAILFGFYAGLRIGDATTQTWDGIDFEQNTITFLPRKLTRPAEHKAKVLVIPLHPVLLAHLQSVRLMDHESHWVTPSLANRPVTNLSDAFVRLLKDANVDPLPVLQPNGRTIHLKTFHGLRHEFVTELSKAGAPDAVWTKLTGHSAPWVRWGSRSAHAMAQEYNHADLPELRKFIEQLPYI